MDIFSDINRSGNKPEAGKLLISEPFLFDSNFKRSVILLCEHDAENGSLGFILNRKLDVNLKEILELGSGLEIPLFLGGPVQNNTLHYIHCDPTHTKESIDLGNGIFWGGNFDEILPRIEMGVLDADKYRFFLGYSGWGKGQLDDEIAMNSWIVSDAEKRMVFAPETNGVHWKNTLKQMGGTYKLLSNYPESPFLN